MAKLPVRNPRISQVYGRKSTGYRKGYHTGIDMVADETDKCIYSVGRGPVVKVGDDPKGWGNYVIVRHQDGHDVLYAHLDRVVITEGRLAIPGSLIGIQGSTGRSTGPHLHFEVWRGDWQNRNDIDPAEYLGIKNELGPIEKVKKESYFEEVEVEVNGIILKGLIPKDEGRAYIQVRELAERFAGNLDWDGSKNRATLEIFSNDELTATIHTARKKLQEALEILGG